MSDIRLIDANALKKKAEHYIVRSTADGHNWNELCVTVDQIDNAPTVFAYTDNDMCQATVDGYDVAKRQFERPQGEWIFDGEDTFKCSVCGKLQCCSGNFCPDCGADMRGEKK